MINHADLAEWLDRISLRNRLLLIRPDLSGITGKRVGGSKRLKTVVRHWLKRPMAEFWVTATNAIGAAYAHRVLGRSEDLEAIRTMLDRHMDPEGNWFREFRAIDAAMKGYPLLYVLAVTADDRYLKACDLLSDCLVTRYPRTSDGSLRYNSNLEYVLVDSLGMACPFLARYARIHEKPEAMALCVNQIKRFVERNVDSDSRLPYHGYYSDGPSRIGMQGWGRGTGWYMIGLIDTLLELPTDHPYYATMHGAYIDAAESLRLYQREDGHWGWAILIRDAHHDSSATSFLGYSLMRGIQSAILDESFRPTVDAAIRALMNVTGPDGLMDGSLSDCLGLGLYPTSFGPQPWLQGMATAFAAVYLDCVDNQ